MTNFSSIPRVGIGCSAFGGLYSDSSDDEVARVIQRAVGEGINYFDTAPLYGSGKSEERLGATLSRLPRDSFVISTKVGRLLRPLRTDRSQDSIFEAPLPFEAYFDFSYDATMWSLEGSLKRLQLDRIDTVFMHDPDDYFSEAMAGCCRALSELRDQGVIKSVGVGMNQWQMLCRFANEWDFDLFLLAGRYTLLDQSALEEFFPLCEKKQIGVILGGVFNSGVLAGIAKYDYSDASREILARAQEMGIIANKFGVSLKAAAIQFCLAHPAVKRILLSTNRECELVENLTALSVPIPSELWSTLKAEGYLSPSAPTPE